MSTLKNPLFTLFFFIWAKEGDPILSHNPPELTNKTILIKSYTEYNTQKSWQGVL